MRKILCYSLCILFILPQPGFSWYPRSFEDSLINPDSKGQLIGKNRTFTVGYGDTLIEIARRGNLGYSALVAANPGIDPWQPKAGTELLLPYATVLPVDLEPGITINLAEYRLYLLWEESGKMRVRIYPIGLGREGWMTPEGDFRVTSIIENPVWTMPEQMRLEEPDRLIQIQPGPDNPLGSHWIGLSITGYGIHGTNRPYGIGRRVSHGCIRLYPRDIVDLVGRVEKSTPVRIIYRPFKVGRDEHNLFVEVHADYLGRVADPLLDIRQEVVELGWSKPLTVDNLEKNLLEKRGIPQLIDRF